MPKDSDYFEEANQLFRDSDPFVASTAEVLYQQMLTEYSRSKVAPQTGFNILYFIQCVIRLLLSERSDIQLTSPDFPYPCESIHAINWPDRLDKWNGNGELLNKFAEQVKADSTPLGDDFDVDYALRILSPAIGKDGKLHAPWVEAGNSEADFDYWLSGFNNEETKANGQEEPS